MSQPAPPSAAPAPLAKPTLSPGKRWFLRLSGLAAILAFLTPAAYVLKYYALDEHREEARAQSISLARLSPAIGVDAVAPPLTPTPPGNAALFYAQAIHSYGGNSLPKTPQGGIPSLSAAAALAQAAATLAEHDHWMADKKDRLGRAIIRFGDGLGQEPATQADLMASLNIERIGLRLLQPTLHPALRKYLDSQQVFAEAVQAKFARLTARDPDNLLLQERVAQGDADPLWRREAVWALGKTLLTQGVQIRRPFETLTGKATLAEVAAQDSDPSVRAAAAATLGRVAQQGAIVRR